MTKPKTVLKAKTELKKVPAKKRGEGPDPVDVHVGTRLKSQRIIIGLSQEKLANAVGITFQQVQKYERGTNRVSASRLYQFGKILKVPVSFFFENYMDNSKKQTLSYGMADNNQDGFDHENEENVMDKKETLDLIRAYYAVPDPKLRKDFMNILKTMAQSISQD